MTKPKVKVSKRRVEAFAVVTKKGVLRDEHGVRNKRASFKIYASEVEARIQSHILGEKYTSCVITYQP